MPEPIANDLELQDVVKRFGQVAAVHRLSLAVGKGEFLSLLGPSGCGKTTALRLIAGYEQADDGEILIRGCSTRGVPPYRRNIGMVFQNYALFPHLTVAENVSFGLRERRVPREMIRRKTQEALSLVQLGRLDARYPSQLSGGQQQRVALARALVIEPDLLLLDEPLSNLDAQLREEMRIEIKDLQAKLGITTVFVTHDQVEALTLSTRLVIMRAGKAAQIGPPQQVYDQPRTRFAFEFLGGANIFPGRILAADGDSPVFETTSGVRIVGRSNAQSPAGACFVGVRPEAISILPPKQSAHPNSFPAQIRNVLYRGWTREIVLALSSGDTLKAVQILPSATLTELPTDAAVTVCWPPEACHLLEGD